MCSTLRTLVRPIARSLPLGKCLSRWPLALSMSWFRPLLRLAEHVLSQTALSPTLSQWDPALVFFLFVPFTKLPAEPRLFDLFSSATSRVIRRFQPWGYQSGSERVSPLTCFPSSYFRSDPTPYQRRISRTSVQPRRKVLGLAPRGHSRLKRARSYSRPLGRWPLGLNMSCVSDCSNAHVKPVGPSADSPTCHPGRVHSTWSTKPPTVRRQRRQTVSACSQSLTCAITLKARSGLKDTRAYASPASLPWELGR